MGAHDLAGAPPPTVPSPCPPIEETRSSPREAPSLVWRAWPAAERPAQAVAVGLAVVAVSLALGAYGGDALLAAGCFAVLLLSLSRYFFPTRYRVDEQGVEAAHVTGSTRRSWAALRTYAADPRGVTLSPYLQRTWLEPYRAVRLIYDRNREEVLAAVAERLTPQGR